MVNEKLILTSCRFGSIPRPKTSKLYFTLKSRLRIKEETSFGALFVLEYWLSNMSREKYIVDDDKTAKVLGIPVSSVKKYRLSLQAANLFHVIKVSNKNTITIWYCIGKEGVLSAKYFISLFGSDCDTVGAVRKIYTDLQIKKLIQESSLDSEVKKDIYNLFFTDSFTEFECE